MPNPTVPYRTDASGNVIYQQGTATTAATPFIPPTPAPIMENGVNIAAGQATTGMTQAQMTTTPNTITSDNRTQQAADAATMLKQQRDANAQAMAALKGEIENEYNVQMEERKAANAEAAKTEGALQFKLGQSGTNYAASQTSVNNLARLKSLDALTQQKNTLLAKAMASYNQDDLNAVKAYRDEINNINDKIEAAQHQANTDRLAELSNTREQTTMEFNMAKATAAANLVQSQFDFEKEKYQYGIDHPDIKTGTKDIMGSDGQMHSVLYNTDNGNTIKDLGVSESLVMDILKKYPDAGILPTDTLTIAENKFKTNSKIYKDQVRGPAGAAASASSYFTAPKADGSIGYYFGNPKQPGGAQELTPENYFKGSSKTDNSTSLTDVDKQGLLGAGIPESDITAIQNDVKQYGLDKVLEGITDQKQKDALNKVYGNKTKVTRAQLETTITSKVAYDGMKDAFTEKELKQFADESGNSSFWTNKGTDIERYLNSAEAKKKYIDLQYEQYKAAGMAD